MERAKKDWQLNQLLIMKEEQERMQDENEDEIFYVCDDQTNKVSKKGRRKTRKARKIDNICFDVSSSESDAANNDEPVAVETAPKLRRYTRRRAPAKDAPPEDEEEVAVEITMLDEEEDEPLVVNKKKKGKKAAKPARKKKAAKEPRSVAKKTVAKPRLPSYDFSSSDSDAGVMIRSQETWSDLIGEGSALLENLGYNPDDYSIEWASEDSPQHEPAYSSPQVNQFTSRAGRFRRPNSRYDQDRFVSEIPEAKLNETVKTKSKKPQLEVVINMDPSSKNNCRPAKNARSYCAPKRENAHKPKNVFESVFPEQVNPEQVINVQIISDVPAKKRFKNDSSSTPAIQNNTSAFFNNSKPKPSPLKTITIPKLISAQTSFSNVKTPTVFPPAKKPTTIKAKEPGKKLITLPNLSLKSQNFPKPQPIQQRQNIFDIMKNETDEPGFVSLEPVNSYDDNSLPDDLVDDFCSSFAGLE